MSVQPTPASRRYTLPTKQEREQARTRLARGELRKVPVPGVQGMWTLEEVVR